MAIAADLIVRHASDAELPWVDGGGGIELKLLRVSLSTGRVVGDEAIHA